MARFNEILVGRYNRFLQKFLQMKGGPPSPQLSTELSATWSLFHGTENRYLEGWERYSSTQAVAAVVGQPSVTRLRNPTGSNVIAVLEKAWMANANAAAVAVEFRHGANAADLPTAATLTNARFDPRGHPSPTLIASNDNTGAGLNITPIREQHNALPVGGSIDFLVDTMHEIPILPGDGVEIRLQTVNSLLLASFWWRERFLEESERT